MQRYKNEFVILVSEYLC